MEEYHQYILQTFMSRGILNQKEVKELHTTAAQRYESMSTSSSDGVNTLRSISKYFCFVQRNRTCKLSQEPSLQ